MSDLVPIPDSPSPHSCQSNDENPTAVLLYELPLTGKRNGHYKQRIGYTLVLNDSFTRDVLTTKTWHRTKGGYPATNVRRPDGSYRPVPLHRFIYEHYDGPIPPGREIDHRDHNKSNNVPSNLWAVTRSINAANKPRSRRNRSGFIGVSWSHERQLWIAKITKNYRHHFLGAFQEREEAARAVNAGYRIHFPELPIPNPTAELVGPVMPIGGLSEVLPPKIVNW